MNRDTRSRPAPHPDAGRRDLLRLSGAAGIGLVAGQLAPLRQWFRPACLLLEVP